MIRKIGIISMMLLATGIMFARGISKENFITKPAKEGWFMGAGIGTQFYVGDGDGLQSTGYRFSTAMQGSVGKWITPSLGVRGLGEFARVTGGNASGNRDVMVLINMHADFMVDLVNIIKGADESRKLTFIPFIGLGMAANAGSKQLSPSFNAGGIGLYRIDEKINLFAEFKGSIFNDKIDGLALGFMFDGSAILTAGFTYNF